MSSTAVMRTPSVRKLPANASRWTNEGVDASGSPSAMPAGSTCRSSGVDLARFLAARSSRYAAPGRSDDRVVCDEVAESGASGKKKVAERRGDVEVRLDQALACCPFDTTKLLQH
jgi:hypothetical protein